MQVIRDTELGGIMMIPLFVEWRIRRCNVKGFVAMPNTIIRRQEFDGNAITFGLCEEHFQQGNTPEGTTLSLEFNEYDAFNRND